MQGRALLRITRQPQKDGHASKIGILYWNLIMENSDRKKVMLMTLESYSEKVRLFTKSGELG